MTLTKKHVPYMKKSELKEVYTVPGRSCHHTNNSEVQMSNTHKIKPESVLKE